jgi:hypothetical protein
MIEIICYTGGTCGDLLAALIDSKDVKFHQTAILHAKERMRFKKPHLFIDYTEKDEYINDISKTYLSIPSHDLEYHVDRQHRFIGITVKDFKIALWAANRFKNLHRQEVWESMCKFCGAQSIEDYAQILIDYSNLVSQHTDRLVKLEDIKSGNAIDALTKIGILNCSQNLYRNWLDLQNGYFIS